MKRGNICWRGTECEWVDGSGRGDAEDCGRMVMRKKKNCDGCMNIRRNGDNERGKRRGNVGLDGCLGKAERTSF